jgi:hypothetical protein
MGDRNGTDCRNSLLHDLKEPPRHLTLAPTDLERFRQLVLADPGLHEQPRQANGRESFVALAVRLGGERGCIFTDAEVRAALRECRRAWLERWI